MYTNATSASDTIQSLSGIYDPLTDLYNRRLFIQVSNSLLRISMRQKMPVSIAMISLDYYAELKAKYGVKETDVLIKRSAELLKAFSRDSDVLSHFDTDKFALLLYNCDYQSSKLVASRIHSQIQGQIFIKDKPVTISIGLAEFDGHHLGNHVELSDQLVEDALRSLT